MKCFKRRTSKCWSVEPVFSKIELIHQFSWAWMNKTTKEGLEAPIDSLTRYVFLIIRCFSYHVNVYVYVWDFVMIVLVWVEIHQMRSWWLGLLAGASEPYPIFGFGAGDYVLGTILRSTYGGCEFPLGRPFHWELQRSLAGNTCNGCQTRTVLTDMNLYKDAHLGKIKDLRSWT